MGRMESGASVFWPMKMEAGTLDDSGAGAAHGSLQ